MFGVRKEEEEWGGSEKKNGAERGEEGGSLREGSHDVSIAQNE